MLADGIVEKQMIICLVGNNSWRLFVSFLFVQKISTATSQNVEHYDVSKRLHYFLKVNQKLSKFRSCYHLTFKEKYYGGD